MDDIQAPTWSGFHEQIRYGVVQRDRTLCPSPPTSILYFPKIWRDFRELRGLSTKFGVYKRLVTFQFPTTGFPTAGLSNQEFYFYKAQTIAAVKDVEVEEQINISPSRREELEE